MDGAGKAQVLYTHREAGGAAAGVHEPRPVQARPRELVLPERRRDAAATGTMILTDVYNSRNLPGVRRGEIVKLLVLESLPKPVNFSGGPDLLSWLGTFTLERVLGTVPVEADGSAHFEVPANRQVFFVALDEKDLSVKRMQSFTCVMPGETLSCGGCHEHRTLAPESRRQQPLAALTLRRAPPSSVRRDAGLPPPARPGRAPEAQTSRPRHGPGAAEPRGPSRRTPSRAGPGLSRHLLSRWKLPLHGRRRLLRARGALP
jgi:hypothetical protein